MGPLFAGLADYDTWFTALRREQSPTRANLQEVEPFKLSVGKTLQKISPLAGWTNRDVWAYLSHHGIPALSLYDLGYTSIGCKPCTNLPVNAEDMRSGRWQGKGKLECGIHIRGGLKHVKLANLSRRAQVAKVGPDPLRSGLLTGRCMPRIF